MRARGRPRAGASSYGGGRRCALERQVRMVQIVGRPRNVEDERSEAALEIKAQLVCDAVVTSDQVGTEGLVVLKRPKPVRVGATFGAVVACRELPVPLGVRDAHRDGMGQLAS